MQNNQLIKSYVEGKKNSTIDQNFQVIDLV